MHRAAPTAAVQVCCLAPGAYRVAWPPTTNQGPGDAIFVDVVAASPEWTAIADVVVWTTPRHDPRRPTDVPTRHGLAGALLSVVNHGHGLWAIYDRLGHRVLSGLPSMSWSSLAIEAYLRSAANRERMTSARGSSAAAYRSPASR